MPRQDRRRKKIPPDFKLRAVYWARAIFIVSDEKRKRKICNCSTLIESPQISFKRKSLKLTTYTWRFHVIPAAPCTFSLCNLHGNWYRNGSWVIFATTQHLFIIYRFWWTNKKMYRTGKCKTWIVVLCSLLDSRLCQIQQQTICNTANYVLCH